MNTQEVTENATFHPDQLRRYVFDVCSAIGSEPYEANLVAEQLVEANLSGHDSHGVGMMPAYVQSALGGRLRLNQHASVAVDNGAILIVEGARGFGSVMAKEATDLAIERARETGVALLGLRNSFHIGRIGRWGEQSARQGLVSISFVNVAGHSPLVAPYGGGEARFATNPVCIAIPGSNGQPSTVLDMATSIIAMGKARVARNQGVPVPDGTVLDGEGKVTTSPEPMFTNPREGALVAFGDHKGSGLAIMAEILGAALIGGTTMAPHHERDNSIINSMLSIVIDPSATDGSLVDEAEAFLTYVKAARQREGFDEVLIPGEPELQARAARAEGIMIDGGTLAELRATATAAGLDDDTVVDLLGV